MPGNKRALNSWVSDLRQLRSPRNLVRLQYFDQLIGEFLTIGMESIKTWKGEPVILTVADGGAGRILIAKMAAPTQKHLWCVVFCSYGPMEPP